MVKNDISFLLSGGPNNVDPVKSIGGSISKQSIDNQINNIFSDVTRDQSFIGFVDYRCLYIRNDSLNEKLRDASFYISKSLEGADIAIGFSLKSDVQALIVEGDPGTGASFQIQYTIRNAGLTFTQTTREILWVPDENTMAQRIAAIVNSLTNVRGIQVIGHRSDLGYDFLITFGGSSTGRWQELLGPINEDGIQVSVMRVVQGGPINSIAPNIGFTNNPPNGVTFFESDNLTPIEIGTLFPQDFVPVWLRRTVQKNTPPIHPDQCRIHMFGEALPIFQTVTLRD